MVFGDRKWLDKKPNKLNLINLSVVVGFGVSWCSFHISDLFEKLGILINRQESLYLNQAVNQ
jgi:hypothetical protein